MQNQAAGVQVADVLRLQNQQLRQENDQIKVCFSCTCRRMCLHSAIYSFVQADADAEAQRFEAEIQRVEAEAQRVKAEAQSLREEIQLLMLAASSPSAASSTTS